MYKSLHVAFYNCFELYLRLTEQRTDRASIIEMKFDSGVAV